MKKNYIIRRWAVIDKLTKMPIVHSDGRLFIYKKKSLINSGFENTILKCVEIKIPKK